MKLPYLLSAALAAAVLVACGGGGADSPAATPAGPTSTPTSVYAAGPITGFGSVIVNGVRFDDTNATITDDDGHAMAESALHLGMQVECEGGPGSDDAHGFAHAIHVHTALIGPVTAVDTTANTLTVLGQTVAVDANTAFDTTLANGLAGVTVGAVVAVHGQFDSASNSYLATRIELDAAATHYKIRGTITALDATAKTLSIGATAIDFSTTAGVPTDLAVGKLADVRLATAPVAGVWTATAIADGQRLVQDHDEAHLRGVVSAFTSATAFSVDGNPVDASQRELPQRAGGHRARRDGRGGGPTGQWRRRGQGRGRGGRARARRRARRAARHDRRARHHGADLRRARRHGELCPARFDFRDGSAATLANGLFVEVRGGFSADGTVVDATRIDLKPAN